MQYLLDITGTPIGFLSSKPSSAKMIEFENWLKSTKDFGNAYINIVDKITQLFNRDEYVFAIEKIAGLLMISDKFAFNVFITTFNNECGTTFPYEESWMRFI